MDRGEGVIDECRQVVPFRHYPIAGDQEDDTDQRRGETFSALHVFPGQRHHAASSTIAGLRATYADATFSHLMRQDLASFPLYAPDERWLIPAWRMGGRRQG